MQRANDDSPLRTHAALAQNTAYISLASFVAASNPSKLSKEQMESIIKLATDDQLTDTQLGNQIRSMLSPADPSLDVS